MTADGEMVTRHNMFLEPKNNHDVFKGRFVTAAFFMPKILFLLFFLCLTVMGQSYDLSRVDYFLSKGDTPHAKEALAQEYLKANKEEREQLEFVAGQIFIREKEYAKAAEIYRKMLIRNPSLTRVRLELGFLYFLMEEDNKARYNLRLVLADKNLPPAVSRNILSLLDVIRQRKSWNLYVSIGLAPDNNLNMVSGRRLSCVNFMGTPICQELDNAQTDIGFQGFANLEYIYKFNDKWGIKNRLTIDALDYQDKQYSFWGIGGTVGPRYVSNRGEYSVGVSYRQQWNDESRYNNAKGLYGDFSVDLSKRLYFYGRLAFDKISYNPSIYQDYNSNNYFSYGKLVYNLDDFSYLTLSAGFSYQDGHYKWDSYFRQLYSLGYGRELPWGFVLYMEPNISLTHYQDSRYFFNGLGGMEKWKRQDTTYGVFVSLSSKFLRIYNITPTINYVYNKRQSNVFNYDYERSRWEIGISRSF